VDLADWVLSEFSEEEKEKLPEIFEKCYQIVKLVVSGKVEVLYGRGLGL
jgi:peptidyl-tRNA hydrolase